MMYNDYYIDKMRQAIDEKNAAIRGYVAKRISSAAVKQMVDNGIASRVLPVGTQLIFDFTRSAGADPIDMPFDIVHYKADGTMVLKAHYAGPEAIQFDAPEAIYFAGSGGLSAGTYHIDIGSSYGTGWATSKSIQFTLANALDEGDQIVINCNNTSNIDPTNGRTLKVYAKGNTTEKETTTTSNGTSGISLGTIGYTSAQRAEGYLNAISHVVYGYGRWSQSALRQYLSSDTAAGAWWTPQNPWDRPPAELSSYYGFKAGIDTDLLGIIDTVDVITSLNTVEGLTNSYETTQDQFYIPSLDEMYIQTVVTGEGETWDYYKALAEASGLSGKFQRSIEYPALINYDLVAKTSPAHVRFRSPEITYSNRIFNISASGLVGQGNGTCYSYCCCPVCEIKPSTT